MWNPYYSTLSQETLKYTEINLNTVTKHWQQFVAYNYLAENGKITEGDACLLVLIPVIIY